MRISKFITASVLATTLSAQAFANTVWCDPTPNAVPDLAGKVLPGEVELEITGVDAWVTMSPTTAANQRQNGGCTLRAGERVAAIDAPNMPGFWKVTRVLKCGNTVVTDLYIPKPQVEQTFTCAPNQTRIIVDGRKECARVEDVVATPQYTQQTYAPAPAAPVYAPAPAPVAQSCQGGLFSDCYDSTGDHEAMRMEVGTTGTLDGTIISGYRYQFLGQVVQTIGTVASAVVVARKLGGNNHSHQPRHHDRPVDGEDGPTLGGTSNGTMPGNNGGTLGGTSGTTGSQVGGGSQIIGGGQTLPPSVGTGTEQRFVLGPNGEYIYNNAGQINAGQVIDPNHGNIVGTIATYPNGVSYGNNTVSGSFTSGSYTHTVTAPAGASYGTGTASGGSTGPTLGGSD